MNQVMYRLLLALIGLSVILALLASTVLLARAGQPIAATFTGTGAGGPAIAGMFKLLSELSQQ